MRAAPFFLLFAAAAAAQQAGPFTPALGSARERTLKRGLELLASAPSGARTARALESVPIRATPGFTGYHDGVLYVAEEYLAADASPALAAVVLATAGLDVSSPELPPASDEGVFASHLSGYRVAVELDIAPGELGEVFGGSLRDWIRDPVKEKDSLMDTSYPRLSDEASWSEQDRAALARYDLAAARKAAENFEEETEAWRKARAVELEAWSSCMDAWLAAKTSPKR